MCPRAGGDLQLLVHPGVDRVQDLPLADALQLPENLAAVRSLFEHVGRAQVPTDLHPFLKLLTAQGDTRYISYSNSL